MSEFPLRRWWWFIGGTWVVLVLYLSLANLGLPQVPGRMGDKINHLIAYAFLMLWFGQLYHQLRDWYRIALFLVFFGVTMELLQGLLPYRWFDPGDALANATGVLLGTLLLYMGGDRVLSTIEHWFKSNRGR